MKQKSYIKRDASGKLYVEQPPRRTLTPEEKLKNRLIAEEMDRKIKEFFKDGVDMSGAETP